MNKNPSAVSLGSPPPPTLPRHLNKCSETLLCFPCSFLPPCFIIDSFSNRKHVSLQGGTPQEATVKDWAVRLWEAHLDVAQCPALVHTHWLWGWVAWLWTCFLTHPRLSQSFPLFSFNSFGDLSGSYYFQKQIYLFPGITVYWGKILQKLSQLDTPSSDLPLSVLQHKLFFHIVFMQHFDFQGPHTFLQPPSPIKKFPNTHSSETIEGTGGSLPIVTWLTCRAVSQLLGRMPFPNRISKVSDGGKDREMTTSTFMSPPGPCTNKHSPGSHVGDRRVTAPL